VWSVWCVCVCVDGGWLQEPHLAQFESGVGWGRTPEVHRLFAAHRLNQPSTYTHTHTLRWSASMLACDHLLCLLLSTNKPDYSTPSSAWVLLEEPLVSHFIVTCSEQLCYCKLRTSLLSPRGNLLHSPQCYSHKQATHTHQQRNLARRHKSHGTIQGTHLFFVGPYVHICTLRATFRVS